ncbi:MAG TPA: DUF6504 family protein [Actinomycetes bacterium]|nr:DUF6504 family protein [Actinomycetes bacterium]
MRRIDESIESLTPLAAADAELVAPMAFRWRGRRYVVDSVLAHWVETGAWWRRTDQNRSECDLQPPADPERWLWRVEAGTRTSHTGVFDLCLERDPGRWSVHAIYD